MTMTKSLLDINGCRCVASITKNGQVIGQCRNEALTVGGNGWLCEYHDRLIWPNKHVEMGDPDEQYLIYLKGQMSREVESLG